MAAPTFIASYATDYMAAFSIAKTLSITTEPGDILVIYAGIEDSSLGSTIYTPDGNGISFTTQQSILGFPSHCSAYLWTGTDTVGGTNWTLYTEIASSGSLKWGITCIVFRNGSAVGASGQAVTTGVPSLSLTTTADESAIVMASFDWNAVSGASRTWQTVNGITPTSGNGLELDYTYGSVNYTVYGAYYNDAGTAGAKTVGLSSPSGQAYSIVAVELLGIPTPITAEIAWLTA